MKSKNVRDAKISKSETFVNPQNRSLFCFLRHGITSVPKQLTQYPRYHGCTYLQIVKYTDNNRRQHKVRPHATEPD